MICSIISISYNEKNIASIWSPQNGRSKEFIYIVLKTLYNNLPNKSDFYILPKSSKQQTTITPEVLVPQNYILKTFTSFDPKLPKEIPTLFPRKNNEKSEYNFARSSNFRFKLAQRDRTCVLTDSWEDGLIAAHIIPHEWTSKDKPIDVKDFLSSVEGGIDSLQNGILLDSTAHKLFDKLHWSVVWNGIDGHWEVVSITSQGRQYEGKKLRWPEGKRHDGILWKDLFPPAAAFEFHFKCAIFQHMKSCGIDFQNFNTDYDELVTNLIT